MLSAMPPGLSDARHAEREGEADADDETAEHQLAGLHQRRQQHRHHRLGMGAGIAEIALQRGDQPVSVTQQDRLIQAVDGAQMSNHLRRRAGVR